MYIEFEYRLDGKEGKATLSVLKGELNEQQRNALLGEIGEKQAVLINQFVENSNKPQYFRPGCVIPGLPENIAFRYTFEQPAVRSVVFNMFSEEESVQKTSLKQEVELKSNQDWVILFLKDLEKRTGSLSRHSLSGVEKAALDQVIAELQQQLVNSEDSSLLLFSAYLQSSVTYFLKTDESKAHFFLLATRFLKGKTNIQAISEAKTHIADDPFEKKTVNFFVEILQRWFAKGS